MSAEALFGGELLYPLPDGVTPESLCDVCGDFVMACPVWRRGHRWLDRVYAAYLEE